MDIMGFNNCPKEEANLGKYGRTYVMFGKLFVSNTGNSVQALVQGQMCVKE